MRPDSKTVAIDDVVCTRDTEKAILIEPVGANEDIVSTLKLWIPKSQIDISSQVNVMGDVGVLVISEWIYDQKKKEPNKEEIWSHYGKATVKDAKNG